MGKYLDIVKRVNVQQKNVSTSPPPYHTLYRGTAESIREECFALDANWLVDQHPDLWMEMKSLDDTLNRMEEQGEDEALYRSALARLAVAVKRASALFREKPHAVVQ
jgi:hypothetical protein